MASIRADGSVRHSLTSQRKPGYQQPLEQPRYLIPRKRYAVKVNEQLSSNGESSEANTQQLEKEFARMSGLKNFEQIKTNISVANKQNITRSELTNSNAQTQADGISYSISNCNDKTNAKRSSVSTVIAASTSSASSTLTDVQRKERALFKKLKQIAELQGKANTNTLSEQERAKIAKKQCIEEELKQLQAKYK